MIKIIAEIGINHNSSMILAKKLIDLAAIAGFNFVKFQKRDVDLCVPEHKKNETKSTPWGDMTYYEYKKRMEFNENDYVEIDKYCKTKAIDWFASVWDLNSAEFMTQFCDIVKVPSALITDCELLEYCRNNFETMIISTGMSTEEQVQKAMNYEPDVVMHTNSSYPANVDELNLKYIEWLTDRYNCEIGYSGHEYGLNTTFATVSMGVSWIERHITLNHDMWGSDQKSSVDPVGCIKLVRGIRAIESSIGKYGPRKLLESEKKKLADLRK